MKPWLTPTHRNTARGLSSVSARGLSCWQVLCKIKEPVRHLHLDRKLTPPPPFSSSHLFQLSAYIHFSRFKSFHQQRKKKLHPVVSLLERCLKSSRLLEESCKQKDLRTGVSDPALGCFMDVLSNLMIAEDRGHSVCPILNLRSAARQFLCLSACAQWAAKSHSVRTTGWLNH